MGRSYIWLAIAAMSALATGAQAQDKSRIPPVAVYQAMLDSARQTGWAQFRDWNGRQLIYFSPLVTLHCRLREIRYSINSRALDRRFELPKCNPQLPLSLPADAGLDTIAISLAPGEADTVAVQVVWDDGEQSEIAVYEPCQDAGDRTCAWPVE